MTQTLSPLDTYRADFLELEASAPGGPGWLADLRRRGMEAFADTGFPTASRGNEKWKYTSVVPISRAVLGYAFEPGLAGTGELRAAAPWDEKEARLVFVDGHYSEELSNPLGAPGLRLDRISSARDLPTAPPRRRAWAAWPAPATTRSWPSTRPSCETGSSWRRSPTPTRRPPYT